MIVSMERWYDLPAYRGQYQVSSRGRVRSLARVDAAGNRRSARMRRIQTRPNGRRYATLVKNGEPRTYCVSVLVAKAYRLPNPRRCGYVFHRNHDNADFRRGNLAWATLAELRMHDGLRFSCPYYGVTCNQHRGKVLRWTAYFRVEDRRREIGRFATPEEAAYAYDRAIRRLGLERPLNGIRRPKAYEPEPVASLPGEIWRPFPGAARTHAISSMGRVRTLPYVSPAGVRILPRLRRLQKNSAGHGTLVVGGRRYTVERVVARVFGSDRTG